MCGFLVLKPGVGSSSRAAKSVKRWFALLPDFVPIESLLQLSLCHNQHKLIVAQKQKLYNPVSTLKPD